MVIHMEVGRDENGRFIARVNGLEGCVATAFDAEEAMRHCKIVALHCVAEMIYLRKFDVPGSIAFQIHALPDAPPAIPLPKEAPPKNLAEAVKKHQEAEAAKKPTSP